MSSVKTGSGYPHALRSELHKALDAAGIQYWMAQGLTFWNCEDGRECVGYGFDASDGTPRLAVKVVGIREPEQAIAMTVDAGTCHIEGHDNFAETEGIGEAWIECDECHWQMPLEPTTPRFKYCPNCRRRVVVE